MMRHLAKAALLLITAAPYHLAIAQDPTATAEPEVGEARYVTELIYTPVRTGPGGDYRILNKGLPSGTEIIYYGTTEDGTWAEVETLGGTRGYLRAQYLQTEKPRSREISTLQQRLNETDRQLTQSQQALDEALSMLSSSDAESSGAAKELEATRKELTDIKRISANAIQLEKLSRDLTGKLEESSTRNDLLKLENARLEDRVASNQRMEGIFAVLIGIIATILIPRLTVRRGRNNGWR